MTQEIRYDAGRCFLYMIPVHYQYINFYHIIDLPYLLFTFKRHLCCMLPWMLSEVTRITEAFSTMFTFKRLLSCMYSLVSLQISCLTKTLVTVVTFERFFSCMYSFMIFEIYRTTKTLVTLVTFVRLLYRTRHSFSFHIVSFIDVLGP